MKYGFTVAAAAYLVQGCHAQDAARVAFDAVSVKAGQFDPAEVIQSDRGLIRPAYHAFRYTPGRVTCSLPLISIIFEAYSVKLWQVSGPQWLYDGVYEVTAVMPVDTSQPQARLMLQTMLRERFDLKIHRENREIPVYSLVIGRAGTKLIASAISGPMKQVTKTGELTATNFSLQGLADWLFRYSGRPVIDATGLRGAYDFELRWAPEYADPTDVNSPDLGLFADIERQLGLKLNPTKSGFSVLVVDEARRIPREN